MMVVRKLYFIIQATWSGWRHSGGPRSLLQQRRTRRIHYEVKWYRLGLAAMYWMLLDLQDSYHRKPLDTYVI